MAGTGMPQRVIWSDMVLSCGCWVAIIWGASCLSFGSVACALAMLAITGPCGRGPSRIHPTVDATGAAVVARVHTTRVGAARGQRQYGGGCRGHCEEGQGVLHGGGSFHQLRLLHSGAPTTLMKRGSLSGPEVPL